MSWKYGGVTLISYVMKQIERVLDFEDTDNRTRTTFTKGRSIGCWCVPDFSITAHGLISTLTLVH